MTDRFDDERRSLPTEGVRILGAEEAQAALDARARGDEAGEATAETPAETTTEGPAASDADAGTDTGDEFAGAERPGDSPGDSPGDASGPTGAEPFTRPRRVTTEGPTWSAATSPVEASPPEPPLVEETLLVDPADRGSAPAPSPQPDLREPVLDEPAAASTGTADAPTGEVPELPHWTEPPTGAVPAIFADSDSPDADLDAWSAAASTPRFRAEGSDWAAADYAQNDLADATDDTVNVGALGAGVDLDEDEAFARDLEDRRRRTPRGRAARTMVTEAGGATGVAAGEAAPAPAGRDSTRTDGIPGAGDTGTGEPSSGGLLPGFGRGRDLPTALATAAVVAVVALICLTQGTFWTVLLAAVIVGAGTLEFTAGLRARGFRPASALALTGAFFLPIAARQFGSSAYPVFFGLMVIFALLWFLWEITPGRPLLGVGTTVFAFAYVGGLGGFAGLLLGSSDGVGLILGVALCVITYDVAGYFVGSQFGKSPIAPHVSPNKSFEGTLAGMVGSLLMGWVIVGGLIFGGIAPWSPGKGAVLGLFVAAGAFLGDLCESMLKRDLGIKDFGSLLPGHGGVLDRFDSLLFCLPITYYLALHLNIL